MRFNDPIQGYNFKVFVDGIELGFKKISNFTVQVETEAIWEGGYDYPHIVRAPNKVVQSMSFTKGSGTFLSDLFLFQVGRRIASIQIFVMDPRDYSLIRKTYCLYNAMVTKWNLSDFDAESGEVIIETLEVQYELLT